MGKNFEFFKQIAFSLAARAALRVRFIASPVKTDRVLFMSFRGAQYSCNPRYISQELQRLAGDKLEIAWAFHEPERFRYLEKEGITVLGDRTKEFLRYAMTAHVICVNTYYKPYLPRRRGQFFLRTWHGGGAYKRIGKYENLPYMRKKYLALQQQGADLYISSSHTYTQLTLRDSFGYKGEVLETGMPRNDMFTRDHSDIARRAREALHFPDGAKMVLYAPTYRTNESARESAPDFDRLKKALKERFGGEWILVFRGHYIMAENPSHGLGDMDATDYPDMQELLAATDVLVTDYSSSIWDISFTGKPVFLYCHDLNLYRSERDFYTDIHTWPFPLSETNDELESIIKNFDEADYAEKLRLHHEQLGACETGHASFDCAMRIIKECLPERNEHG